MPRRCLEERLTFVLCTITVGFPYPAMSQLRHPLPSRPVMTISGSAAALSRQSSTLSQQPPQTSGSRPPISAGHTPTGSLPGSPSGYAPRMATSSGLPSPKPSTGLKESAPLEPEPAWIRDRVQVHDLDDNTQLLELGTGWRVHWRRWSSAPGQSPIPSGPLAQASPPLCLLYLYPLPPRHHSTSPRARLQHPLDHGRLGWALASVRGPVHSIN